MSKPDCSETWAEVEMPGREGTTAAMVVKIGPATWPEGEFLTVTRWARRPGTGEYPLRGALLFPRQVAAAKARELAQALLEAAARIEADVTQTAGAT